MEREADILKRVKTSKRVEQIIQTLGKHRVSLEEIEGDLEKRVKEEGEVDKLHEKLVKERQEKMNQETRYY